MEGDSDQSYHKVESRLSKHGQTAARRAQIFVHEPPLANVISYKFSSVLPEYKSLIRGEYRYIGSVVVDKCVFLPRGCRSLPLGHGRERGGYRPVTIQGRAGGNPPSVATAGQSTGRDRCPKRMKLRAKFSRRSGVHQAFWLILLSTGCSFNKVCNPPSQLTRMDTCWRGW